MVHGVNDTIELSLGNGTKVEALRKDATESSICILILPPFPRVMCMSKKDSGSRITLNHAPECKLTSTVIRDGSWYWSSCERGMYRICGTIRHEIDSRIETRTLHMGEEL